jgi:hypothetical protein
LLPCAFDPQENRLGLGSKTITTVLSESPVAWLLFRTSTAWATKTRCAGSSIDDLTMMPGMERQYIIPSDWQLSCEALAHSSSVPTTSCHDTTAAMSAQRLVHMAMSTAGVRRAQSSLLRMSSSFLSTSPGVR